MTTLREAAGQALEALDGVVSAHSYTGGTPVAAIAALRAALAHEPQTTHSNECWRWHHACAVAEIERLKTKGAA